MFDECHAVDGEGGPGIIGTQYLRYFLKRSQGNVSH